jgi:hypothetical protein
MCNKHIYIYWQRGEWKAIIPKACVALARVIIFCLFIYLRMLVWSANISKRTRKLKGVKRAHTLKSTSAIKLSTGECVLKRWKTRQFESVVCWVSVFSVLTPDSWKLRRQMRPGNSTPGRGERGVTKDKVLYSYIYGRDCITATMEMLVITGAGVNRHLKAYVTIEKWIHRLLW